jgi:hypothetical protein
MTSPLTLSDSSFETSNAAAEPSTLSLASVAGSLRVMLAARRAERIEAMLAADVCRELPLLAAA